MKEMILTIILVGLLFLLAGEVIDRTIIQPTKDSLEGRPLFNRDLARSAKE